MHVFAHVFVHITARKSLYAYHYIKTFCIVNEQSSQSGFFCHVPEECQSGSGATLEANVVESFFYLPASSYACLSLLVFLTDQKASQESKLVLIHSRQQHTLHVFVISQSERIYLFGSLSSSLFFIFSRLLENLGWVDCKFT